MNKLNITYDVLDKLGFSEYRDGAGDYGTRTLKFENGEMFRITEHDQQDDGNCGWSEDLYVSNHFTYRSPDAAGTEDLFFLHEMHEIIKRAHPSHLAEFRAKCKAVGMVSYLPASVPDIEVVGSAPGSVSDEDVAILAEIHKQMGRTNITEYEVRGGALFAKTSHLK